MNNTGKCPFCSKTLSMIMANDGGSLVCSQCGLFHHCINGPVKGSPGPALCPNCDGRQRVGYPLGPLNPGKPAPSSVFCDGCNVNIPMAPGHRFKCRTCANFDFCKNCVGTKQHDNRHTFYEMYVNGAIPSSAELDQVGELHSR